MQIDQIASQRVRGLITGSCTPARNILDLEQLSSAERAEAEAYFRPNGGLQAVADTETAFERNHGC